MRGLTKVFTSLVVAILSLSMLACSGGGGGTTTPKGNEDRVPTLKVDPTEFRVVCRDMESCLPYAGSLLSYQKAKEGNGFVTARCTFFLIAPDVIATNDHCLMDGKDYLDNSFARFPASGAYPEITVQVKELIFRSNDHKKPDGLDYAYLRLNDPVDRPIVAVDRSGMPLGEYAVLRATAADPNNDKYIELQLVRCNVIKRSVIFNGVFGRKDQTVMFNDCPVIQGDSGSAILDISKPTYTVVGQINKRGDLEETAARYKDWLDPSINYERDLGIGTNYLCVPHYTKNAKAPMKDCVRAGKSTTRLVDLMNDEARAFMVEKVDVFNMSRSDLGFDYELKMGMDMASFEAKFVPKCYHQMWAEQNIGVTPIVTVFLDVVKYAGKLYLDEDLGPAWNVQEEQQQTNFVASSFNKHKQLEIEMHENKYLVRNCPGSTLGSN